MSNLTAELDTMNDFNTTYAALGYISYVTDVVTLCIELPVICLAAFALYHQVKADHVTPVYVINLLISDFIQIIVRLIIIFSKSVYILAFMSFFLLFGLVASILFMVCIALERYLLVVHPLWYRCHRTIKHSILISLAAYAFEVFLFVAVVLSFAFLSPVVTLVGCASFLILPLPFLVFFLVATWRALSHSISVPHKEKKRILGTLTVVMLIYLVLFFPAILTLFYIVSPTEFENDNAVKIALVSYIFFCISPLMDLLLYILLKKDARYTQMVPLCCRRLCTHKDSSETTVSNENVTSV